jgi:hypothetical protein
VVPYATIRATSAAAKSGDIKGVVLRSQKEPGGIADPQGCRIPATLVVFHTFRGTIPSFCGMVVWRVKDLVASQPSRHEHTKEK